MLFVLIDMFRVANMTCHINWAYVQNNNEILSYLSIDNSETADVELVPELVLARFGGGSQRERLPTRQPTVVARPRPLDIIVGAENPLSCN